MPNKITTDIAAAVQHLKNGELVAFATETVYGLGADARNEEAIRKVFAVKQRPLSHPLIVHLAAIDQLHEWAIDIPAAAWQLATYFWPGPLTMILKKHPQVSDLISGGQDSVAIRIPQHPMARELLRQFGSGLVAPSANKYGKISPTTAQHVATDLKDQVAAILDGGPCEVGIESTIVNLLQNPVTIMRYGMITAPQLSEVLHYNVEHDNKNTVRTPGNQESHYAPLTPLYLLPFAALIAKLPEYVDSEQTCSVISLQAKPKEIAASIYWHTISNDPAKYAHDLYATLRAHDRLCNAAILIEAVPDHAAWAAITDRLQRASS